MGGTGGRRPGLGLAIVLDGHGRAARARRQPRARARADPRQPDRRRLRRHAAVGVAARRPARRAPRAAARHAADRARRRPGRRRRARRAPHDQHRAHRRDLRHRRRPAARRRLARNTVPTSPGRSTMRSDIAPGGTFPDYELPDHANVPRRLSELQGDDPLILTLARGHYCPKEHQQHLELAAFYPKIAVAYTQIVTISTDDHHDAAGVPRVGRRPVAVPLRPGADRAEGPRHPGVHRPRARPDDPAHARAQARPGHPQRLQRLLVLGAPLGRRPLARPARRHPRDPPRLGPQHARAARGVGRGRRSPFHGWNKQAASDTKA